MRIAAGDQHMAGSLFRQEAGEVIGTAGVVENEQPVVALFQRPANIIAEGFERGGFLGGNAKRTRQRRISRHQGRRLFSAKPAHDFVFVGMAVSIFGGDIGLTDPPVSENNARPVASYPGRAAYGEGRSIAFLGP